MTWICYIGIEISARTQYFLLGMEVVTLGLFAIVALVKTYAGDGLPGSIDPSLGWLNPFEISTTALIDGVLLGVFIYWGGTRGSASTRSRRIPPTGPEGLRC